MESVVQNIRECGLLGTPGAEDHHGRDEVLAIRGLPLDATRDIQASHHAPERRKALTVRIAHPTKVERWLRT